MNAVCVPGLDLSNFETILMLTHAMLTDISIVLCNKSMATSMVMVIFHKGEHVRRS